MTLLNIGSGQPSTELIVSITQEFETAHSALSVAIQRDPSIALLMNGLYKYGQHQFGYLPLRQALASRHNMPLARTYVTPGALLAHEAVATLHAGQRVVILLPTYFRLPRIYQTVRCKVETVPLEIDGSLDLDRLRGTLQPGDLFVCVPFGHNPWGPDLTQLYEILTICNECRAIPVLDLAYQEFGPEGESFLRPEHLECPVILIGTFAKTLMPSNNLWGGKVGYVIFPDDLQPQDVLDAHMFPFRAANFPIQWKIEKLMWDGAYGDHTKLIWENAKPRLDHTHERLQDELGDAIILPPKHSLRFFISLIINGVHSFDDVQAAMKKQGLQVGNLQNAFGDGFETICRTQGVPLRLGVQQWPTTVFTEIPGKLIAAIRSLKKS